MHSFGSTWANSNFMNYGDLAGVDTVYSGGAYSGAFFYALNNTTISASGWLLGKGNMLNANAWNTWVNTGNDIRIRSRDYDNTAREVVIATASNDTDVHSVVWTWDTDADVISSWYDGVAVLEATSYPWNPAAGTSYEFGYGNRDGSATGAAVKMGHCCIWTSPTPYAAKFTTTEAAQFHAGVTMPRAELLAFWAKCIVDPNDSVDAISQTEPTVDGTVTLVGDSIDAYFSGATGKLPVWRDAVSRELRRRRFPEETYSMTVPLEYLAMEVMDELNISHDSIPRAASLLTDVDNDYLMEQWQRLYGVNTSQTIDLNAMSMKIDCVNSEPAIAYSWSTDIIPEGVDNEKQGVARISNGASWHSERPTLSWIEQSDGRLASITGTVERINHLGFIGNGANENLINNSAFVDWSSTTNADDWTESLGTGGAVNRTTTGLLFVNTAYPYVCRLTKGSAGDVTIAQAVTVVSTDGSRTFGAYTKDDSNGEGITWKIQRTTTSDSYYWNDSTPAWQSGAVVNSCLPSCSWTRTVSEPITCDRGGTWTLTMGLTSGLENDTGFIGQVDITHGPYILAPIVTPGGDTYAIEADRRYLELLSPSSTQYLWPINYGTFRCTFTAEQDYDRLDTGDKLVIYVAEVDDNNYDELVYENDSGTCRFAFRRYRSGSLEATAYNNTNIVRGTEYEIATRWVYQGELGLSNYTLSMFVDGTKGTDDQASGVHSSTSTSYTLFVGTPSTSLTHLPCSNYMSNWEFVPRVIPDEEIEAHR